MRPVGFVGSRQPDARPLGERRVPAHVGVVDAPGIFGARDFTSIRTGTQPFAGVLAQGFEKLVPMAVRGHALDHRLVDERGEDLDGVDVAPGAHGLHRGEVEAAGKSRQPGEEATFVRAQENERPCDGVTQCAMPRVGRAHAGAEHARGLVEPLQNGLGIEGAEAGGNQFDGQGQPVEATTDLTDNSGVRRRDGEARHRRGHPVDEKLHGMGCRDLLRVVGIDISNGERRHGQHDLAREPERFARGGQHVDALTVPAQTIDQRDEHVQQVFAVVEHDEHLALGQRHDQCVLDREVLAGLDIECGSDGVGDGGRVGHRRQLHEHRRLLEVGCGHRDAARETGLAHATRSDEGDERRPPHGIGDAGEVARPAHEPCRVVGERTRRRSVVRVGWYDEQCRVVGQDLALDRRESGRRVEAHVLAQVSGKQAGAAECLGLATIAEQRHHPLALEPLAQGMPGRERFEVTDQRRVAARREAALHPGFGECQADLVEPHGFGPEPLVVGEVTERSAAPPFQGRPVVPRRVGRVGCVPPELGEPGEMVDIEPAVGKLQPVAVVDGHHAAFRFEDPSEPRYVALQGRPAGGGLLVTPQGVTQPIDRDHGPAVRGEHGEHEAGLRAERTRRRRPVDDDRAEDPHRQTHHHTHPKMMTDALAVGCKAHVGRPPAEHRGTPSRPSDDGRTNYARSRKCHSST